MIIKLVHLYTCTNSIRTVSIYSIQYSSCNITLVNIGKPTSVVIALFNLWNFLLIEVLRSANRAGGSGSKNLWTFKSYSIVSHHIVEGTQYTIVYSITNSLSIL